jgi:hypothetical protein
MEIEDNLFLGKWKTTSIFGKWKMTLITWEMEDDLNFFLNGRHPQYFYKMDLSFLSMK